MRTRYPRTPHLRWSPGATADDVRRRVLDGLDGLDGENTTLARDYTHARSLDSAHHPSRARIKALQGRVGPHIPPGWRTCGEKVVVQASAGPSSRSAWPSGCAEAT